MSFARPSVFICYRRSDSQAQCDLLFAHLQARLGDTRVFRDIDRVGPGDLIRTAIAGGLDKSNTVLVLIGKNWAQSLDGKGQRRLDDPEDYVRNEIELALAGRSLVIPVLVDGATIPPRDALPVTLQPLLDLAAAELGSGQNFHVDLNRLYMAIGISTKKAAGIATKPVISPMAVVLLMACLAVAALSLHVLFPPVEMSTSSRGVIVNQTPQQKQVLDALDEPAGSDQPHAFDEQPIASVMDFIRDSHGVSLRLDDDVFAENQGATGNLAITVTFEGKSSLRAKLRQLTGAAGPEKLAVALDARGLVLTTTSAGDNFLEPRLYPVNDLIAAGESLMTIGRAIADDSSCHWKFLDDSGGQIARLTDEELSITQTFAGHAEVERILSELRISKTGSRRFVFAVRLKPQPFDQSRLGRM